MGLVIYEEGAISGGDLPDDWDAVVFRAGTERPVVEGHVLFASKGSVVAKPFWMTLVEVRSGKPYPVVRHA